MDDLYSPICQPTLGWKRPCHTNIPILRNMGRAAIHQGCRLGSAPSYTCNLSLTGHYWSNLRHVLRALIILKEVLYITNCPRLHVSCCSLFCLTLTFVIHRLESLGTLAVHSLFPVRLNRTSNPLSSRSFIASVDRSR
jgi:hypothetical protein